MAAVRPARAATIGSLLDARHVAVVGASDRSFMATVVQRNLRRWGYDGRISQVSPTSDEVAGHRCHGSLAELDEAPDVIVVLTPTRAIPAVLGQAGELGVGWAVVPGAGEMESGAAARDVHAAIAGRDDGLRVLGPNCMGFACPGNGLTCFVGTVPPSLRSGPVTAIVQSGSVSEALVSQGERIGYRAIVSTGNELDLTTEELIEHFLDEGRTQVLMLVQEGVRQPSRFFELLRRAADAGVVVAVLRIGRSAIGAAATATHTGAISGDWDLWVELMRREGAVVAESLDELLELAALAQVRRRPMSASWWVMTVSGGQGAHIADVAAQSPGIALEAPGAALVEAFARTFPDAGPARNPLDTWAIADVHVAARESAGLIAEHAGGGTLIAAVDASDEQGDWEGDYAAALVSAVDQATRSRPAWSSVHVMPVASPPHARLARALSDAGMPSVKGHAGLRALATFCTRRRDQLSDAELASMGSSSPSGPRLEHRAAVELLQTAGIRMPRAVIVGKRERQIPAVVAELREPFVVKAVGPAHRAAIGGVAVGVSRAELDRTCERIGALQGCVGVEVSEHATGDLELLVAAGSDPQLGPRITLGVGGALAEQARRTVCDLAPVERSRVLALLERLVGQRLERAAWASAVVDAVIALGRLLHAGQVSEIEINPLIVDRFDAIAVAVDVIAYR